MATELDLLKGIRILAFQSVKAKDHDYVLRFIARWFSREFHTPLAQVDDMPTEDLLLHFFEAKYEGLDEEELATELKLLTETDAEREAREQVVAQKLQDDEEFEKLVAAGALAKKSAKDIVASLKDKNKAIPSAGVNEKAPMSVPTPTDLPIGTIPPDINMTFVNDEDLGDLDSWDILGAPGTPKAGPKKGSRPKAK